jgi:IS5 family transposase
MISSRRGSTRSSTWTTRWRSWVERSTGVLEERFGAVYSDKVGHPPLSARLMAGLSILKHIHDLSEEDLCARWVENPYYQLFCGEEFFQHKLTFDRSSLTRWRQRMVSVAR